MSFAIISVASGGGSGSSLTWLWILIAAVAVIGVVVLVLVRRRFGPYTGPDSVVIGGWLSGAIQAIEQGSALGQAISAALRPEAEAAGTSGARWPEIQRRADDLARALDALRKAAAESEDRARAVEALGHLRSLRFAIDEQQDPDGAGADQAETVRARLAAFETSLRNLRSPQEHLW